MRKARKGGGFQTLKACNRKIRHETKEDAEKHAKHPGRRNGSANARLLVYRCTFCHGWHVGHKRVGKHAR